MLSGIEGPFKIRKDNYIARILSERGKSVVYILSILLIFINMSLILWHLCLFTKIGTIIKDSDFVKSIHIESMNTVIIHSLPGYSDEDIKFEVEKILYSYNYMDPVAIIIGYDVIVTSGIPNDIENYPMPDTGKKKHKDYSGRRRI